MKELEALAESAGFGPDFESAALTVWQPVPLNPGVKPCQAVSPLTATAH
jgi:hypothetical protein